MTEQEFWVYFKKSCKEKKGWQNIGNVTKEDIIAMGNLLFEKKASRKVKEVIIMTLAHQPLEIALTILKKYNQNPEPDLKFFAKFALEECAWWND